MFKGLSDLTVKIIQHKGHACNWKQNIKRGHLDKSQYNNKKGQLCAALN